MLITGARVYTLNTEQVWADAVAIADGDIIHVGSTAAAQAYIGDSTHIIDAGGGMVLPGFIDTHLHVGDTIPYVYGCEPGGGRRCHCGARVMHAIANGQLVFSEGEKH